MSTRPTLAAHQWQQRLRVTLLGSLLAATTSASSNLTANLLNHHPQVDARGMLTIVLIIDNHSGNDRQLRGIIDFPAGWHVHTPLHELHIPAHSARAYPVLLQASASIPAGRVNGQLQLLDEARKPISNITIHAQVPIQSALEISLLNAAAYLIEAPFTLQLTVRNSGNTHETVRLEADPSATFNTPTFPLEPGEARHVTAHVELPHTPHITQPQRISIRALSNAGSRAELTHHVTLIPTQLTETDRWHQVPITVRLSAALNHTANQITPNARVSVNTGGAWRDGARSTLTIALDSDLLGRDPRLLLEYHQPNVSVHLGHAHVGLHPNLSRARGFGLLAHGRWLVGESTPLSWAAFTQLLPRETTTQQARGRYGVRFSSPLGTLGSWSLSAQRNPGFTEARAEANLRINTPTDLTLTLHLEADVHAPHAQHPLLRAAGSLRAHHPHGSANLELRANPTGFPDLARDTRELMVRAEVNLAPLLGLNAHQSLRANGEYRHTSHGYTRSSEQPAAAQPHTLEEQLTLRFTTRLNERWRITPQLSWSARGTLDTISGKRAAQETLTGQLSSEIQIHRGTLLLNAALSSGPQAGANTLTFSAEFNEPHPTSSDQRGMLLRPRVRFSDNLPTRVTMEMISPSVSLLGFVTEAAMNLSYDADNGFDWRGRVSLEGRFPIANHGSVDLRARIAHGVAGTSAELTAHASINLNPHTSLLIEGESRFGTDNLNTRLSVSLQRSHHVTTGPRAGVGSVEGRVTRSDGQPLAHVAFRIANQTIASDANGSFRIPAVTAGEHAVQLLAGTLPTELLLIPASPIRVQVRAGEVTTLQLHALQPAALVGSVRFTLPEDDPTSNLPHANPRVSVLGSGDLRADAARVAGLTVQLERHGEIRRALTDTHGHVHFSHLEPGIWHLHIDHSRLPNTLNLAEYPRQLLLIEGETLTWSVALEPRQRRISLMEGGTVTGP